MYRKTYFQNQICIKTHAKQPISDVTRNILHFDFGYSYLWKYIMHYSVHYEYLYNALYM